MPVYFEMMPTSLTTISYYTIQNNIIIMVLKARLLLVLKGAGTLVYGYCLMYTVAHHVINYVVVSAAEIY
jgi:uncharacterized membrane protein YkgB